MKVDAISSVVGGDIQSQKPPQFSDRDKRDEVAREVNLRKSVYPGQVRQGRMRHEEAERRKAIMYAIWLDYCAKVNGDTSEPQAALDLAPEQPTTIGVDPGAGDDRTSHHVIAGGGDGEIIESAGSVPQASMQPKYDSSEPASSYPTGESTPAATPHADSVSSSD